MRLTISKSIILMIFGTINCIIKHNHGKIFHSFVLEQPPCHGPVKTNTVLSRKVIRKKLHKFCKKNKEKGVV